MHSMSCAQSKGRMKGAFPEQTTNAPLSKLCMEARIGENVSHSAIMKDSEARNTESSIISRL